MARKPIRIETPRGVVYHDKNMKAVLEWNTGFGPEWTGKYSKAQKDLDGEVLRSCEPYTPHLTGILIKTGTLGTEIGSGTVRWIAPYSRYQYYGKVMIGSKPKTVTNKPLTYHGGGMRGSFWFERAKEVHKPQWIKVVGEAIKSEGK